MTALAQRISSTLQPYVDRGTLAGAVLLVADARGILAEAAIGWSDISARAPLQADALFWIASVSKPITAVAALMLWDEGRLDLDAAVERYLPEFKGQQVVIERDEARTVLGPVAQPITVRQALAHTSGLPFMSRPEAGRIDTLTLREAALTYALSPLEFAPGSKFGYSNAGTNTVGRIIEVVSGMPYAEFLQQRLLTPLGMTDTTFVPTAAQLARLAKTYRPTDDRSGLTDMPIGQFSYPLDDRHRHASPAGGLFSTARDLACFGQLILNDGVHAGQRLVSAAALAAMTSKQTGAAVDKAYGLACDAVVDGLCGHGGAYANDLRIARQQGRVLIYMVQHAGYGGTDGGEILPAFRQVALS